MKKLISNPLVSLEQKSAPMLHASSLAFLALNGKDRVTICDLASSLLAENLDKKLGTFII